MTEDRSREWLKLGIFQQRKTDKLVIFAGHRLVRMRLYPLGITRQETHIL